MVRRIRPAQVTLGMFIHGFEGSWFDHPFWRSRFLLEDPRDLARVQASAVSAVLIDETKGKALAVAPPERDMPAARAAPSPPFGDSRPTRSMRLPTATDHPAQERHRAKHVAFRAALVVRDVFDGVRRGRGIRSADVGVVVDDIMASLDRNRSMLIGITRLKSKDEYTYLHSVAVCALMVNLSRELGLDDAQAHRLGLAGLLHDVGKMMIDDAILTKPGRLTGRELAEMRDHPVRGHALLLADGDAPPEAIDVCLHHHERMDGAGYPHGLCGPAISLAARLSAICDVYDATTTVRPYKSAWSPVQAITAMEASTGHFDPALLFPFMKSIGVFPVDMLVRLRSNRLALVLDNGRRATRAKVRAFYAIPEGRFVAPADVILSDTLAGDQVIGREDPAGWGFADWDAIRALIRTGRLDTAA